MWSFFIFGSLFMAFGLGLVTDALHSRVGGDDPVLGPVHDLFFGSLQNPSAYLYQRFLNVIQGLESFHRRVTPMCEEERMMNQDRVRSILVTVPDEHRSWVKEELRYSFEPNLRSRLRELLKQHEELVPGVGSTPRKIRGQGG